MSARNGDKSRHHRLRKQKLLRRKKAAERTAKQSGQQPIGSSGQ